MATEQERCDICGERFSPRDEVAEMYDPEWGDDHESWIVHAQCGLARGMEVA